MILVTGGTGFVGQMVVRQLKLADQSVRLLLRPSRKSPNIPQGMAIEAAISSLTDERSLRAALKGVDTVIHLAGAERLSSQADLSNVDVLGTQTLAKAASDVGVDRFIFLSHLGADQSSFFPVLRAKGLAEAAISRSRLNYTILRSAVAYGPGDQFTVPLARLLKVSPGFFFAPAEGENKLQPVWGEDLASCIISLVEDDSRLNQTIMVGGGETLSFREVTEVICDAIGIHRRIRYLTPHRLKNLAVWVENTFPKFPVSIFWLDYLAADRICAIDSMPRQFGILPARFSHQLEYLKTAFHNSGQNKVNG
jgi:uncharacterized protein YbjT (DUF2867 family)